jgi:hypothetical protein
MKFTKIELDNRTEWGIGYSPEELTAGKVTEHPKWLKSTRVTVYHPELRYGGIMQPAKLSACSISSDSLNEIEAQSQALYEATGTMRYLNTLAGLDR